MEAVSGGDCDSTIRLVFASNPVVIGTGTTTMAAIRKVGGSYCSLEASSGWGAGLTLQQAGVGFGACSGMPWQPPCDEAAAGG